MTLRSQYSGIPSAFNDFLFASVGEEKNGTLTVLSALTRLGIDPWLEAARLADLPRETGARALAAAIAVLPEGDWKVADLSAIATRLVNRLPSPAAPAPQPAQGATGRDTKAKPRAVMWLVGIVLLAGVLFSMSHSDTGPPPEPSPGAVSSPQR